MLNVFSVHLLSINVISLCFDEINDGIDDKVYELKQFRVHYMHQ